jgi:hypothetical protein
MNQEYNSPFSSDAENHEDFSLDSFSFREGENQNRADFLVLSYGGANRSNKGREPNEENPIISIDPSELPDRIIPFKLEGEPGTNDDDSNFLVVDGEEARNQAKKAMAKEIEKLPQLEEDDFEIQEGE